MFQRWPRRWAFSPWADVQPSDLEPQGEPETVIEYRREAHLGLYIKRSYGQRYLGILAVRCESVRGEFLPISMAIADAIPQPPKPVFFPPRQSSSTLAGESDGA